MPIYMKYEGIQGTATGKHKGWIELESCHIGKNTSGRTDQREAGEQVTYDINITKFNDNASVLLLSDSSSGKSKKVTIDFVRPGEEIPYMSVEVENATLTSFSLSGRKGDAIIRPTESWSLSYSKITFSLKPTITPKDSKQAQQKAAFNAVINQ